MSEQEKPPESKLPPVELDTAHPEPNTIWELPKFLHSSPSFRRVFYGTTGAFLMAAAGAGYMYLYGPDQTHNPLLNGTLERLGLNKPKTAPDAAPPPTPQQ